MRLIWYNRDAFSDRDMIRAKAVANRLLGKKKENPGGITLEQLLEAYSKATFPSLLPNQMVVSPSQFGWEPNEPKRRKKK